MWGPPVRLRRTLGRVAGPAEHRAVGDVEGRTTCREGHDVIDGQVDGGVGVALVSRAPVPVLSTPCPKDSGTQVLPGLRAVQSVVAAAVRLPSVRGTAAAGSARDDTADGAEFHRARSSRQERVLTDATLVTLDCRPFDIAVSVSETDAAVYSPAVLRLRVSLGGR